MKSETTETPEAVVPSSSFPKPPPADEAAVLEDRRFVDPLIQQIVEIYRQRNDMLRARTRLELQSQAICRRFCDGDKVEGGKLYRAVRKNTEHEHAAFATIAVLPLLTAMAPLEKAQRKYEKELTKLGKQLPVAHMADEIKGLGHLALAKIVGECGDLSAYQKGVSGVWKRCGLAVINGKRQRRIAGQEALEHAYNAARRSALWNITDALFKSQGMGENAGYYRTVYDERKAYEVERDPEIRPAVAHNRSLRYMCKRLLRDIYSEWLMVNKQRSKDDS